MSKGGASARNKGAAGEREARDELISIGLEARKISRMYQAGPDLIAHRPGDDLALTVEVKRRKTNRGFAFIEGLVHPGGVDAPDLVMARADHSQWVVSMSLPTLERLLRAVPPLPDEMTFE